MDKTIGFIGSGNMGSAMIGGILSSGIDPMRIVASALSLEGATSLANSYGIQTTTDNLVPSAADILFLAVKPNVYPDVISQIRSTVSAQSIVVSIAPGLSIRYLSGLFGKEIKLVRAMPNTPALVGEGMSALCPNENVTEAELAEITDIFNSFGKSEIVSEYLLDTVTGVSGSSPAYIYILIEAMSDAAVADGMPRAQAYKFASQAVLGSAKMVIETGLNPGTLKDMVCSPGGTTIEAVAALEREGFRNSIITAQRACVEKSKNMGR
ncbi:pyrroline-5-carboxylate reductase [Lachnospiraceae bacterium ZAX-1]